MPNNLQTKILKYIKQHDKAVAYKIETANERGVPDILCCLNGVFVAIEVKEDKDTVKPIQEAQVDRILEAGGHAWFIRDFEIFKTLFEGVYHGNGKQQRTN